MANENDLLETIEYKLFNLDKNFKNDSNLNRYIDQAQNFYNGNQYPEYNPNNMIRITMNICSFDVNIKASKICGTPIYITYTSDSPDIDCTALRQFDEYNQNKMRLKTSNFQAAINGFTNGTEVTYTRWDKDDTSYKGIYKGGLVDEHIDLRNFAVANPYIESIQNQQWVMFWDDIPVAAIKDMIEGKNKAEIKKKKELVEKELNNDGQYKKPEHINHALCRMYTRFFRIKGEVYFNCSTKYVNIFSSPHPLSRKLTSSVIEAVIKEYEDKIGDIDDDNEDQVTDLNIDYEDIASNIVSSDKMDDNEYSKIKEKFSLYPFSVFRPFNQNRSFYGRSDIKQMIPIQKALNYIYSMMLKCVENNAYNKIFAKPEALRGQKITNEPNQLIVDYSGFTNGWGIKFAETQPMPNGLIDFGERMLASTRTIYGFSDVMDGSISNQDMSGYMLQQMIKQSNTILEQQQQLFWEYNIDKAAIRLMYYKHYVEKAKYTFEMDDANYEAEEQARMQLYNATLQGVQLQTMPNATPDTFKNKTRKTQLREFKSDVIYGSNFDISIEAMQGLSDSKLIEQQMWDDIVKSGAIQNMNPDILDAYFKYSPNVSPRTKTTMHQAIENIRQGVIAQKDKAYSDLMEKTQFIIEQYKQLEAKMGMTNEYVNNLTKEFTNKINQSNKFNDELMRENQSLSQGEKKSQAARGISNKQSTEQSAM